MWTVATLILFLNIYLLTLKGLPYKFTISPPNSTTKYFLFYILMILLLCGIRMVEKSNYHFNFPFTYRKIFPRINNCPLPGCSHGAVKIRYLFQEFTARTAHESSMNRLWSRGKYNIIGRCLDAIDWEYELESHDVDTQYCVFVNYLFPLICKYVPLADTFNKGSVPWSVNPPREMLRRKNDAWSLYKSLRSVLGRVDTTTVQAWEAFRTVNSEIKYFAINSQRTYEQLLGD